MRLHALAVFGCCLIAASTFVLARPAQAQESVARQWNEELLEAIRNDFARPTVHARNLFHVSVAMWDAWAAYDEFARTYLHHERATATDLAAARDEAISYAAYTVLKSRFSGSPGAAVSLPAFDARMASLGYDPEFQDLGGSSPGALGIRVALSVLLFGATDGANELGAYANQYYEPVNPPLIPAFPGNSSILNVNRWQPLTLQFFVDQAGNPFPFGTPSFLGAEWGRVTPFALTDDELTIYSRDSVDYWVYHDPGPPPLRGGVGDAEYRAGFEQVVEWSGTLDPSDGVMIDISPNARGDNTLGTNDGSGHALNPVTGLPYSPQIVPAGDYYRVLAEFWADGPDSETPPGHWFTIANYVSDHPAAVKRVGGVGPVVDDLEWDVKLYLALGGGVHDAAVAAWGAKGAHDYIRPISAIRSLADQGQRTDPSGPSYHPDGIGLTPGVIEVITPQSIAPGERHAHLADGGANLGKIAVYAWRGPDSIGDPGTTIAGVGWILAEHWWPYQRPSFVTPPFAGYVSGHSTFSRAAAELMTSLTGDAFFPGGMAEFVAPQNEFLVFEDGPSVDVTLQWATYRDASDETSISRIYGGIHPRADDIPGRLIGAKIGDSAFQKAEKLFGPWPTIDLARAMALPSKHGRIFWGIGTIETGVYGSRDVFEPSDGMTLTLSDGADLEEVVELASGQCRTWPPGRGVISYCRSQRASAIFRRSGDKFRFRFFVREPITTATASSPTGPFRLTIAQGATERAGSASSCNEWRGRLFCHQPLSPP